MVKRILFIVMAFVLILSLGGCAAGSVIITGQARSAIDPTVVKTYLEEPSKYETIGLVEASSDVELSAQAAQDRVIMKLRKLAAKIGANGVLLTNTEDKSSGMSGFYSGNYFYAGTSKEKTARGQAIYVIEE